MDVLYLIYYFYMFVLFEVKKHMNQKTRQIIILTLVDTLIFICPYKCMLCCRLEPVD